MKHFNLMFIAIAALFSASCANQGNREKVPAIDLANLDTTVAPGQDFYEYATAGWQRNHPLKGEYSRYGAFDVLRENNEIRLNELFKGLASQKKAKEGSVQQKITDLYTMGLDSVRLNKEGAAPVLPDFNEMEEIVDAESFAKVAAKFALSGLDGAWGVGVEADLMDSDNNVLYLGQSGLALGNRDYYVKEENASLREGYKDFLTKVFTLAGCEDAAERAEDAFNFEMAIAVPYWSMVQQRDMQAQYNPMSTEEVCAAYPGMHLAEYFEAMGIPHQDKIIVCNPSYFEALGTIIESTPGEALRHYLQAHLLQQSCGSLSDDFYEASFDFFSRQMSGIKEPKPRWKRAMAATNGILSEAVGQMYVAKYFPEEDKIRMREMVSNIQQALGQRVANLDWMSEKTKEKAQEKLDAFTVKIGYPDKWKDYSSLTIDSKLSYYENRRAASEWYVADNLSKLGKPVDKDEWGMSPQTVNAYYNPTTNEICFPAGILQPPFYNSDADDAVNYGAIGVVISHEMTHGFDDQGRLFDKEGNMNNWWTEEDAEAFKTRAAGLVEQFNQVEIQPGLYANGAATLGENIADQGGLRIAFTALQNSFAGNHPEPLDGFTAEQRFYLAYATLWAQNITPEEEARLTLLDVHSLGRNRVNATLKNIDTFFEAFGIKEGDAMYRPENERVVIW